MESPIFEASTVGDLAQVGALLKDHPDLDVNWKNALNSRTSLHSAAFNNHPEVVKLLLAHPAIAVNVKTSVKATAFHMACVKKHVSIVRLFLQDPRVGCCFC